MDSIIEVDSRVWEGGLMSNHRLERKKGGQYNRSGFESMGGRSNVKSHRSEVKGLLKVQVEE